MYVGHCVILVCIAYCHVLHSFPEVKAMIDILGSKDYGFEKTKNTLSFLLWLFWCRNMIGTNLVGMPSDLLVLMNPPFMGYRKMMLSSLLFLLGEGSLQNYYITLTQGNHTEHVVLSGFGKMRDLHDSFI